LHSSSTTTFKYENVTDVPSAVDWRQEWAVTPIKDQGKCGKFLLLRFKISDLIWLYALFTYLGFVLIFFSSQNINFFYNFYSYTIKYIKGQS
jgi:hypothetical protein